MQPSHKLARQLLGSLDPEVCSQLEAIPEVETVLASLIHSAKDAWPTITLASAVLLPYLAKRLPLGPSLERALRNWRVDDLYLCCACAAGDRQAIALFRQNFGPGVLATLNGLRLNPVLIEDVQQHVMLQLLAGSENKPPMITDFGGLGRLSRWLRVVTARTARKMLHREKKLVPVDDDHLADKLSIDSEDTDLQRIKQIYRKEFKSAFKQALTQLPSQQVNLIRYRFGEGLTLEQIGEIYRVHHSTVLRRLEQVKRKLLARTHDLLRERLDVTQNECLSVIRMIQSNFDITLQTFLSGDKVVEPKTDS